MIDLKTLKETLHCYNVVVCFSGAFSQGVIEELSEAIGSHFRRGEVPKSASTNVISVFVEQAQNIINYNNTKLSHPYHEQMADSGIVTVGKYGEGYFVSSGNLVAVDDLNKLVEHIDYINALDAEGLKKYYKDTMKADVQSGTNGAGLGLILMARKGKAPIEYHVNKRDDNLAYFSVSVIL